MTTEYSIEELIQCVQREVNMRQTLFPELIAEGSLTHEDAVREINMMIQVGEHLIRSRNRIFTPL
ncbi:MAG: hypothetical protein COA47_17375 [Robiginitomaculum sp.]|nr:MAG: hypothetical protein COA47_17375 [Robiginitomaculum sp.]